MGEKVQLPKYDTGTYETFLEYVMSKMKVV